MAIPRPPAGLIALIKEREQFIIAGHKSPDGDCISSQLALSALLKKMGKRVLMANSGPFERAELDEIRPLFAQQIPESVLSENPTLILVDCATGERTGDIWDSVKNLECAVIDHHAAGEEFGDVRYVVPSCPSTTLLIEKLWQEFSFEMDAEVANTLFLGFATDSGFFRFLTPPQADSLNLVATLLEKGASPAEAYSRMNGGKKFDFIKYLGKIIERAETEKDGRVVISYTLAEDEKVWGSDRPGDLFYAQMLSVQGVEGVILIKQVNDNTVELGLRASHSSKLDVSALAKKFGGGGHVKASGATTKGTITEVKAKLLKEIEL